MNDILSFGGLIDWETFTFNLEGVQMDNLFELPGRIMRVIANPADNPLAALLVFALFAVFLLFIVLTVMMVLNRPKNTFRVELAQADVDTAADSLNVESDDGVDFAAEPADTQVVHEGRLGVRKDSRYWYFSVASFVVIMMLTWLSAGAITQFSVVCKTCHSQNPHVVSREGTTHESVACVRCHESGGLLSRLTMALPARIAHITVGTFADEGVPGYAGVEDSTCKSCHAEQLEVAIRSEEGDFRVSHREIVSNKIPCSQCHIIGDETGQLEIARNSMQTCVLCHSRRDANLDCATCHLDNSQYMGARARDTKADFAKSHITEKDLEGNNLCYRCHNPASCNPCHGGLRMPHPGNYVSSGHVTDTYAYGKNACYTCHQRNSCQGCHTSDEIATWPN